jgi:soluble lytic murein transglycosylase
MIDTLIKWKWWMFALIALGACVVWFQWSRQDRDHRYDDLIQIAAARYQVDPALIKAVIWRESRFNPDARGTKSEVGLMQIGALAGQEWADAEKVPSYSHQQLLNPVMNAHAGTWYLAKMLRRYAHTDSPVHYALADYNAGRTHVLRWNKGPAETNSAEFLRQMDFPMTRRYVQAIVERSKKYNAEFQSTDNSRIRVSKVCRSVSRSSSEAAFGTYIRSPTRSMHQLKGSGTWKRSQLLNRIFQDIA